MKRKHAVAAIFTVAAVGFTYVSPYIAMYRISMAARSVRTASLAQYADLPALRASVARQLRAAGEAGSEDELRQLLDRIVSPPGLTVLILHGKHGTDGGRHDFRMSYRSWNEVVLRRAGAGDAASAFVLHRRGMWDWQLADLALPADL